MQSIAKRIKKVRQSSGLSQAELAGKLGVSNGTISHWEAGISTPRYSAWERFKNLERELWNDKNFVAVALKEPQDFVTRLKSLKERFDLTQKELAEELGVSYPTVAAWEIGKNEPSHKYMPLIEELERKGPKQKTTEEAIEIEVVEEPTKVSTESHDVPVFVLNEDVIDMSFESEIFETVDKTDNLKAKLEAVIANHTARLENHLLDYGHVAGLMQLDEDIKELKALNRKGSHKDELKQTLFILMADAWQTINSLD